jgi:two-component system response regulator HydG
MPHIVADRFVALGKQWFDFATAAPVRLRIVAAESRVQQAIWTDSCEALARLRHPLLNPLIDYGALDGVRLFEAYALQPPVPSTGAASIRLLQHAARFLEIHGVHLTRALAEFAVRAVTTPGIPRPASTITGRPVGVVLQHRRVLDYLAEVLDGDMGGTVFITVRGGTGSGLTTLQTLAARDARLRGYAPICAAAVIRWPWITDAYLERHLCLLTPPRATPRERSALARWLARLGAASARGHAAISFRRGDEPGANALRADSLGVRAMTSMVYMDDRCEAGTLFEAAREADGRPGLFLNRLNAAPFDDATVRSGVLHETAPAYIVPSRRSVVTAVPPAPRRARVAAGACAHASRLAARGRHAASARVLTRAFRVLHGRGEPAAAAATALQLGWLLRDRGDTAGAHRTFERARAVHSHVHTCVAATVGTAVCWTDEGRLREAEAAARGALAAAEAAGDRALAEMAAVVLARVLYWLLRLEEAAALLAPLIATAESNVTVDARALAARVRLAGGETSGALHAAREALRAAGDAGTSRALAAAHRAAAAASMAVGDLAAVRSHVERGLAAARDTRTPLKALRLRALLVSALTRGEPQSAHTVQLGASLMRAAERRVPPLLRWQIVAACDAASGHGQPGEGLRQFVSESGARALLSPTGTFGDRKFGDLQRFLEVCHAAPDDRAAIERVCADLRERLQAVTVMVVGRGPERRRLAIAGRPWAGEPRAAVNAAETGLSIATATGDAPPEAAEPLKYGGDVIAALCCRWTAAAPVDPYHAGAVLRVAALALGPSVRSLLDRALEPAPSQVCPELLGTSATAAALRDAIARAARAPFPVLVEGESGTGKELVARAIHRLGPRRDRRFCAINCAAITDELLEAELFGHARGAFTGAVTERAGLFEEADGGTLFLDEVGELSARAQAKLLRVLQDGGVRRIGENFPRRVDARVIAATNRRLADEVASGRFRADLRYRLDVVRLDVPPLRERLADIPILVERFWAEATARVGSGASLAPDAVSALSRYDWPGNVRELQNVIASMSIHAPRRGRVTASLVPSHVARSSAPTAGSLERAKEEFERRFVRAALARAAGHPVLAARALGVSRQGLAKMMKRLGIQGAEGC